MLPQNIIYSIPNQPFLVPGSGKAGYLAIFDGHGGDWTSSWLARSLHRRLLRANQILGNLQGLSLWMLWVVPSGKHTKSY